jgi:hypothetical protein
MIICRKGQQYCQGCIQETREPTKANQKKLHTWAAVSFNFKSDLIFYDVPTNNNGKMTSIVYINEILEKHVKLWIESSDEFVLEEDHDSGHSVSSNDPQKRCNNPVKKWKAKHGLKSYFNCNGAPDLSPIENCWLPMKEYIRKYTHWEPDETQQLAKEGWYDCLTQEHINKLVLSMPERLQAVIDAKGKMTGY